MEFLEVGLVIFALYHSVDIKYSRFWILMKTFFVANVMHVAFIDKLKFPVATWTESVRHDSPKDNAYNIPV